MSTALFANFLFLFQPVETLSEDEEENIIASASGEGVSISVTPSFNSQSDFTPTPGGPFSALTPSMWPQDIMAKINHPVSSLDICTVAAVNVSLHIGLLRK